MPVGGDLLNGIFWYNAIITPELKLQVQIESVVADVVAVQNSEKNWRDCVKQAEKGMVKVLTNHLI